MSDFERALADVQAVGDDAGEPSSASPASRDPYLRRSDSPGSCSRIKTTKGHERTRPHPLRNGVARTELNK